MRSYTPERARIIRSGELKQVNASEIVPGDLVEIAVGDRIPADIRISKIFGSCLRVDQAILTGESIGVQKTANRIPQGKGELLKQDQANMAFSGTTVTMGRAQGIVVLTGTHTAIGEIQASIKEADGEDNDTPLKKRLNAFGDQLARIISIICVLVWLINIRHFADPQHGGNYLRGAIYYFKIAVALAVAAIPEGLAVVITTCLALGTRKMAQKKAIVRSLPSVETLGCTSVICSDKTGTLTTNEMSVVRACVFQGGPSALTEYSVTGSTFSPNDGQVWLQSTPIFGMNSRNESLYLLSLISSLCNDAKISYCERTDRYVKVGESTEAALKVFSEKLGSEDAEFNKTLCKLNNNDRASALHSFWSNMFQRLQTLDFDRDRKSMSVIVESSQRILGSHRLLLVKGAPESIIRRSVQLYDDGKIYPLEEPVRKQLLERVDAYGGREALRVLGFAIRPYENPVVAVDPSEYCAVEDDLIFVGLMAMLDPPRAEIKEAIETCRSAGIRVIMVTGDAQPTARAIADRIGLVGGLSMTGPEFDALGDEKQRSAVAQLSVLSRTEPRHKQRLVQLLQDSGAVVAMTGDGVNDAPALRRADIGIAMGSGTDVARLAADMVLANDNFSTIVDAVEEGRCIYDNTKQFIRYLISSNIGEVVSIFLTVLLGLPEALSPVQLLWVNLVTDGLPATALSFNPPALGIMKARPRDRDEPLVGSWLLLRYVIVGGWVGLATVAGFAWWMMAASRGPQITWAQLTTPAQLLGTDMTLASTMSLSILVTVEMFNALNGISELDSLLAVGPARNPALIVATLLSMALHMGILYIDVFAGIFGVSGLNSEEWLAVLALSVPVVFIDEGLKALTRRRQGQEPKFKKD